MPTLKLFFARNWNLSFIFNTLQKTDWTTCINIKHYLQVIYTHTQLMDSSH